MPFLVRASLWLIGGAGLAGLAASYAMPYLVPGSFDALYAAYGGSVGAGIMALYGLRAGLRTRDCFMADADGLVVLRSGNVVEVVPWDGVARVRQRPNLQRLDVELRDGRSYHLEYQLTHFDYLAATVARYAGAVRPGTAWQRGDTGADDPVAAAFRSGRGRWVLPILVPVFLLGSAAIFDGILILAWLSAGACFAAWFAGWSEVRVDSRGILIERPFRTRRVPWGRVAGVELAVRESSNYQRQTAVLVGLDDQEILKLSGVREGEMELYRALRRHWPGAEDAQWEAAAMAGGAE